LRPPNVGARAPSNRLGLELPRIHVERLAVSPASIDANRHVGNLEYLRWMQDVATAHSAAQGWPLERYVAVGAGWFVRSHAIEYRRPAFEGDALSILTWVAGFGSSSSQRRYLFWRANDRQVVAQAATLWVFVNFATGRPTRILPEVRSAFQAVPDDEDVLQSVGLR
jgi:acyl-CoA thioester hydrolase